MAENQIIYDQSGIYDFEYVCTEEYEDDKFRKVYKLLGVSGDVYIFDNEFEFDENGRVIMNDTILDCISDILDY